MQKNRKTKRKNEKTTLIDVLNNIAFAEFETEDGKVNYRLGILLLILILGCTAKDWFLVLASYVRECIKTKILEMDVVETAETVNLHFLIFLFVAYSVICVSIITCRLRKQKDVNKQNGINESK